MFRERLREGVRVRTRPEDVFDGRSTHFPSDRSVFFTEAAYAMVLVMLSLASEIAGRPVDFEEAGINFASVSVELQAFFAHYSKKWVLIGAVGRQIGICKDDGTVSWDVDKKTGQRCAGSRYFKAQLPSDAAVQSLRNVMDIVSDPKTTKLGRGRFWVIDVEYLNQDDALLGVESYTAFGYRREAS